ncbi:MAG: hypothetical protein VKL39_19390 [Leptolyngbyaceae bacterium]|nr:hypothetical protein [Leptolyngbyaceae bacterium]
MKVARWLVLSIASISLFGIACSPAEEVQEDNGVIEGVEEPVEENEAIEGEEMEEEEVEGEAVEGE